MPSKKEKFGGGCERGALERANLRTAATTQGGIQVLYGLIHYNAPGDTLEEFLNYAAEAGFDCVELQIGDLWPERGDPEERADEVRVMLEDRGLKCSAVAAGNDFNVIDEDQVRQQVERFQRVCELAMIVRAPVIRTEGGAPKEDCPEERWVEAISNCILDCLDFVEDMGLILAVDNHGWITNNPDVLLNILEVVDSPQVGTNLDTMNYRWYGHPVEVLPYIYERVAPWVKSTHFKDGTGSRGDYRGTALGEGEIPLESAVWALKAAGYQGAWVAEYEGPRDQAAEGYRRCLQWLRENT
jgi:sugar phosphate isomerase/epimerase